MTDHLVRLHNAITRRPDRGAALAEYGMLIALVFLVVISIVAIFGRTLVETFGFTADAFPGGTGTGTGTGTDTN